MFGHDERLARWFAANQGIITTAIAADLDIGEDALLRRHRAGLLVREHHGVYRSATVPASPETRIRAAVEAAGAGAFVSGHSLMRVFDARGEWSDTPEITLLGTEHLELEGVRIRRIDRIQPYDIGRRHGMPILSVPLGLLTLGASASPWKVQTAVHDLVFQRHTARPLLIRAVKDYGGRGRRGMTSFRKAVNSLDPKGRATQTNLELTVVRAIADDGRIPEPHLQFPVLDADGTKRKLDLAWPDHGLDLETDGDRWHLNPTDKAEMQRRDAALLRVGYEVWRVDSDDVPGELAALLRRLRMFFGI